MAYRRRQGNPRPATYEEVRSEDPPSLAAQAIMASSAHRDSSLSSVYAESAFSSRHPPPPPVVAPDSNVYEYTSIKNLNEPNEPIKSGFWGVIARKAKSIIDDDTSQHHPAQSFNKFTPANPNMSPDSQHQNLHQSYESFEVPKKSDGSGIHKRLDAFANSLNYIGGKVGNALEEGLSVVETRTADIIQETRKLNIRRKGSGPYIQNQGTVDALGQHKVTQIQNDHETQLKASRDVANAMAAKAKLLLRELKTVKADLAFAKARCSQLEEENKILRESRDKQGHPEDDDLIRLQLETLLAEKSRLAHENSVYARENRFLREIVEYHQLTMQDVVYFDEGTEEVTEVYPMQVATLSTPATPRSPSPTVQSQQTSTLPSPQPSSFPTQEMPTVPSPQVSNGDATISENVDACHEDVEDKKTQHSSA